MVRRLTEWDIINLAPGEFEVGYDDDDEDKHQFCHICYPNIGGALCGSGRLWFQGVELDITSRSWVDCSQCIEVFRTRNN